jgi:hypothetical protein
MRVMWTAATCVACVLFAGCAQSSGVLKVGPDTYTVSAAAAPARGGSSEARKIALTEANQHCAEMGKEILVTNVGTATINAYGAGTAEVTFRCLDKAVATTSVPAHAGLTGTYKGEITGTVRGQAISMRVTFTLVQNGQTWWECGTRRVAHRAPSAAQYKRSASQRSAPSR